MKQVRAWLGMTPGNPMNAFLVIFLVFFGMVLVGAPVAMAAVGMGAGGIMLFELIALGATVLVIWILVVMARGFGRDREQLLAGGAWAHWRLSSSERMAFLQQDRERTRQTAKRFFWYALALVPVGAGVGWLVTRDATGALLGAALLGGVGLLVVVTTWLWDGARPKHDADDLDEIYLGDLGIQALGRFTPLSGINLALKTVSFTKGDPGYLTFTVVSRGQYGEQQPHDVPVPVPAGHDAEAEALVLRFRERFKIPS
jgi:hypothetical protein